jgi:hypothetical protein
MATSEVTDLIAALQAGSLTLDEVAERFRRRSWPRTRRPAPTTATEMAESLDPPPDVPGSYDDLTAAYDRKQITWEQYRTLVEAAAESIRAERPTPQRHT